MSLKRKDIRDRKVELQHRHFCAIAEALRDSKPLPNWCPNKHAQWQSTVNSFVAVCRRSNGRFDSDRFIAACNHEVVR